MAVDSSITVRDARLEDIPLLDALGARLAGTHRRRLSLQRAGVVVYLVARLDECVAGHLMLTWAGASEKAITSRISDCPTIIDLLVASDLRCRGIGSCLLAEAERRASERGFSQIGLAVGVQNTRARALYDRQGYRDAGIGTFTVTWTAIGPDGHEQQVVDTCIYLTKDLHSDLRHLTELPSPLGNPAAGE